MTGRGDRCEDWRPIFNSVECSLVCMRRVMFYTFVDFCYLGIIIWGFPKAESGTLNCRDSFLSLLEWMNYCLVGWSDGELRRTNICNFRRAKIVQWLTSIKFYLIKFGLNINGLFNLSEGIKRLDNAMADLQTKENLNFALQSLNVGKPRNKISIMHDRKWCWT